MTETYEAAYYASVVDDLRVANERLHETINDLRTRLTHADQAHTLIRQLLTHLDDGNPIEDVVMNMHRHIEQHAH
jgi:hypothetical protein